MVTTQECLRYLQTGAVTKGDADISGKGVILAFLISAYVSFTAVLVAYVTDMLEDELLTTVDRRIMRIKSRKDKHPRIHETIQHIVLLLSDQQIVTGIPIMAAGFVGLRGGQMSVYHYQIVLYLAWLSSSVHLSALTLLRPFLNKHQGLRAWRLLGMIVLFFMLIVGLVPTVSYDWGTIYSPEADTSLPDTIQPTGWGIPAICFWGKTYGDGFNDDAPNGYLILIFSYVWKMGDLFVSPRNLYNRTIRRPLENFIAKTLSVFARRYMQDGNALWLWCFQGLLVIWIPLVAFMEAMASFSASLWLSALGLVFGTIQIVIPRYQNLAQAAAQESKWGFGQLVPLVLLVQPIGAISEHAWIRQGETTESNISEPVRRQTTGSSTSDHGPESEPLVDDRDRHLITHRRLVEVLGQRQASYEMPAEIASRSTVFMNTVLTSRLFGSVVAILHVTILGAACVILSFDAQSIGYERGQNWTYALIAIGVYASASWLALLIFGPYSRLGRRPSRRRAALQHETHGLQKLPPSSS
ncbi:hypothetical protein D6D17_06615 [Aureobasidium pullulans]|nr:hypothetical protein D6D17_06615 [Aureobasidium pullulans]